MSDPITYRFSTFQELVDEVPSDRICDCLEELGKVIQTAKATAELCYKVAEDLARKKELPPMPKQIIKLPDALEWIDDGKGELEAELTDQTGARFVGLKITNEAKSDTPQTDAVWRDKSQNILEHARALERDCDALKRELSDQKAYHAEWERQIQQLEVLLADMTAERDALKADKERLDWLETKRLPLIPCFGIAPPMGSDLPFPFDGWVLRSDADEPMPLRTAIDAARKEQP